MRKLNIVASVVVAALSAALVAAGETPAPAPAGAWVVIYKSDFKEPKLPKEWTVLSGEPEVKDGAILMKNGDEECQITLSNPKAAGDVKLEFDGTLRGEKISDLSPSLNAGDDGFASGYLLQFAAGGNTENRLRKEGEVVESTVSNKPLATAGKKHHVVAQNENGVLTLVVDGQPVMQYKDAHPLKGALHSQIGFYTFGCTLKIENIVLSKKEAPPENK